jgi:class 3 adenylate cyclase
MPLFMDRHNVPDATAQDVAAAHLADLAVAPEFGVQFISYWFDPRDRAVFCFANAPSAKTMEAVHAASHGLVPAEIIGVSENDVLRFLGRIHEPVDHTEVTSPFRTILFTDLEGSTALLDSLGQEQFMPLLREHDLIVRRELVTWRGREVKHTGDGFLASFDDVTDALHGSLAIISAFRQRSFAASGPALRVRIGMAAGEPVDHDDDIFGAAVTLANRICTAADPGHVLVSDVVHDLGVGNGFVFDGGSDLTLKGFSRPAMVYELLGAADQTS